MRTDYILYIIAVICLVIAGYSYAYPLITDVATNYLIIITLAIIGIIFIGSGYSLRPRSPMITQTKPQIPPPAPIIQRQPPAAEPTASPEKEEEQPSPEAQPPKKRVRRRRTRKKT